LRESLILSNSLFTRIARSKKPTVAAIQGACLGGGLELALACHFRLCSDRARLGLPEVWIKLVPGLGGVYRLHQLVGKSKTLELVALGDLISSEEALRLNIVNRVFPKADFAASVNSFVQALLMAESNVLTEAIQLVYACNELCEQDNLRLGMEAFAKLAGSWSRPTA
jgi:enoyl-CoA hydratase/carnithine racemase